MFQQADCTLLCFRFKYLKGFNVPGKRDEKAGTSDDCADSTENFYHMVKPCEVVDTNDSEVIDLISPALLLEHLGLYYLNREISAAVNPVLKANLGIKRLTTKHLIEIGRQETKKVFLFVVYFFRI